ncbi:MAG TPA: hypothetical protein VGM91_04940 [Conexibacter sp.]|jgi:chromosome segregation ATPase
MPHETSADGIRARLSKQGEDALGRLAQELLESPLVNGALTRAFDAREKAAAAQEVAMGALNLPSAADLEKLTRRVRSVSQRMEGIEDALDRVEQRVEGIGGTDALERRLDAIDEQLGALTAQLAALAEALAPGGGGPAISVAEAARRPSRTPAPAGRRAAASSRRSEPRG